MLSAKPQYNHDVIINKCVGFYYLKNSSMKLQFSSQELSLKSYLHSQSLYIMQCFYNFPCKCLKQAKTFDGIFSFIYQSHSFNSKQLDKQISCAPIILELSHFFEETIRENGSRIKKLIRDLRITNSKFLLCNNKRI